MSKEESEKQKLKEKIEIMSNFFNIDVLDYIKKVYNYDNEKILNETKDEYWGDNMKQGRDIVTMQTNIVLAWIHEDFFNYYIHKNYNKNIEKAGMDMDRQLCSKQTQLKSKFFDFIVRDNNGKVYKTLDVAGDNYNNINKRFTLGQSKFDKTKKLMDNGFTVLHGIVNIRTNSILIISCENENKDDWYLDTKNYPKMCCNRENLIVKNELFFNKDDIEDFIHTTYNKVG